MKIGYLMQDGVVDIRKAPLDGPAIHVTQVINELRNLGHEVVLLAKFGRQIYRSDDMVIFKLVSVRKFDPGFLRLLEKIVRWVQSKLKLPYANLFESIRFALACRQEISDCNILFERFGWIGYGGWLAAKWMKIPIVWEVNGDHVAELEFHGYSLHGFQKWLSLFIMRHVAKRIDFTVATGNGWRQKYISRWDIDPSKISVVENGSLMVDKIIRSDLSAFHDEPVAGKINVVYMGAFEPWHGIHVLVKAFSAAVKGFPQLHLDLLGDGPEKEKIVNLIHSLDLGDFVNLTGSLSIDELIPYLKRAEIGVSPYCGRPEYSGLKLLDYKSAGLAIIASGADGQPDVLVHEKTGWIIPPCDEDALSRSIVHLSTDDALRRSIGRAARLDAEKVHRWRNTAEHLESIFKRLLPTLHI